MIWLCEKGRVDEDDEEDDDDDSTTVSAGQKGYVNLPRGNLEAFPIEKTIQRNLNGNTEYDVPIGMKE